MQKEDDIETCYQSETEKISKKPFRDPPSRN